jgi:prophage regulatory protein
MTDAIHREPAVIRRKQVETRTGLARSTIYQYMKDGVFPKPVQLGPRAVGWIEADISAWIAQRIAATGRHPQPSGGNHHAE